MYISLGFSEESSWDHHIFWNSHPDYFFSIYNGQGFEDFQLDLQNARDLGVKA